jgi:hypothetical protein
MMLTSLLVLLLAGGGKLPYILALLTALLVPLPFWGSATPAYLSLTALALFLFFGLGIRHASDVRDNRIRFHFLPFSTGFLAAYGTAFVLFGVLMSFPSWRATGAPISSASIQSISTWAVQVAARVYPEWKGADTVTELSEALAEKKLEEDPRFLALSPAAQRNAVREGGLQVIQQIEAKTDLQIASDASVSSVVSSWLSSSLKDWQSRSPQIFLVLWAVVAFFIFKGISAILIYPLALLGYLCFETLLALDIIHITGESQIHERVVLS